MILNVAVVQFPSGYKNYHFKNDIEDLKKGDTVVVDTINGMAVGLVVGFEDASVKAEKWVVQKVDLEKHLERIERENKIKELKRKMEKRRKELEDIQLYVMLAKEDQEMAEMVKQLLELEGKHNV
jgi:hypothetical protein